MTVSTHVYSAVVIGTTDLPLSVVGGRITLDESQAPHVTGNVDIATPSTVILNALDPRAGARVRVVADGEYPSFSVHREFDLGLRVRPHRRLDATVTLSLASDEALLLDWSPLTDDTTPYQHMGSLRAICNYVLGQVIPGASLEASPTNDADCTPLFDAQNLLINPGAEVDDAGCHVLFHGGSTTTLTRTTTAGTQVDGVGAFRWEFTGPATAGAQCVVGGLWDTEQGHIYTVTAYLAAGTGFNGPAIGQTVYLDARVFDTDDYTGTNGFVYFSDPVILTAAYQRVVYTFTVPRGAKWRYAGVGVRTLDSGMPDQSRILIDRVTVVEGAIPADLAPEFTGDNPDTADYTYSWDDVPNESTSTRIAVNPRSLESLRWQAGTSAMEFLQPLVQAAGYRLVCDEQRRWTLRGVDYQAAGVLSIREGVNLIDREDTIDRDAGTWFDARITRYHWTGPNGDPKTKEDAYTLNMPYTRLSVVDVDAPYPGAGRSQYAVRRAQGRGHEGSATAVADWRVHAEQALVITDGDYIQTGEINRVEFSLDRDEMTVTSRTTDTPLGAIDLIPGTIDALTGTIDNL